MTTSRIEPATVSHVHNPFWDEARKIHSWMDGEFGSTNLCTVYIPDYCRGEKHPHRQELMRMYSCGVLSEDDVLWFKEVLDGQSVVEIGAGTGYWAYVLNQAGISITAYDKAPPSLGENEYFSKDRQWYPIAVGDERMVLKHPDDAVLLSWPNYGSEHATRVARHVKPGGLLIYCGEGEGGNCAPESFFQLLDRQYDLVSEAPWHVQFEGLHDYLAAYRKKSRRWLP